MKSSKSVWIWYPGDFEIYHGMLQNFQREERGFNWPAFWKMDDWEKNVRFYKEYVLEETTTFRVTGHGDGYVAINGKKHLMNQWLTCEKGTHLIEIYVGNMTGLPCAYIEGDVIYSNKEWMADNFMESHKVGTSKLYVEKEQDPNQVYVEEKVYEPIHISEVSGGVLMDFGRMIDGTLDVKLAAERQSVTICYGESDYEACDTTWCYFKQENVTNESDIRRRAFRYIYVPDCKPEEIECRAVHRFVPIEVKASFQCEDERLNQIWKVAEETYKLCSGLFFIDGVKRDRWIWSGDAYQSYVVNPYLFFDEEIDKRTLLALRGNMGIKQHLNTIVDYSLLWIIAVEKEYWMTKDREFVEQIYPKVEDLMRLCMSQLNENGFIYGRERDWIFIDWSDMDKDGVICAEQILLLKCYQVMQTLSEMLGKDASIYKNAFTELKEQITKFFWNEEKGAFIDCYQSGKNNVTRHANIFAILFDLVEEEKVQSIVKNVLFNPEITQITTPYFKFFELDALCKLGYLKEVFHTMKSYWGSMLERGAVTFWEEFDPTKEAPEQYSMYGDPFGKSLCHAWGASPIYLLGRYFLGIYPLTPGYDTFAVEPKLEFFKSLDCVIPVKNGSVMIKYDGEHLQVTSDREGGILRLNGESIVLTN